MNLPKLIAAYDPDYTKEFEDGLQDQLGEFCEDIPLEQACEHGGYPLPEDVSVYKVESVWDDERCIYATVSVSFAETVNTTCADVTVPFQHDAKFDVSISKDGEEIEFEMVEVEHEHEF
jgi:hypothetical protein